MKCPVLPLKYDSKKKRVLFEQSDCLQGECAWWDDVKERCAILTVGFGLGVVGRFLKEMRENMPTEKQFRK